MRKNTQLGQSFLEIFQKGNKIELLRMSDEAPFHMNGFVNKQNFRHWGIENLQMLQEKSLHTLRVTVWCAIMHDRVICLYFYENEAGITETVNGERY